MTRPLPPRAVLFGRLAADARERLAATLYNPKTVLEAMSAAATAGACLHVIKPPEFWDLQHTAAAGQLVELLQKQQFRVAWVSVPSPIGPNEPPAFELWIRWSLEKAAGDH